jgi:hypothetical protein
LARATLAGPIVLTALLVILASLLGALLLLLARLLTGLLLILLTGALLGLITVVVRHCVSFHGGMNQPFR